MPDAYEIISQRSGDADLLASLEKLVPAIAERAHEAEQTGRIPQETIDSLQQIGLFRAVVPASMGGLEVEFPTVPKIFRLLGRGCMSTAWCMGFLVYHNFQFAHFGQQAQQEVWGTDAQTMAPGQVMPSGKAVEVEGGYRVSGRWGYATGILHGDWMLFSAPVEGSGEIRRFYAPISEFEILDTWHVSAMKATGSHDVQAEDMFVPAYRSVLVSDLREGRAPGLAINHGPLWRIPLLSFMSLGAVMPLVGGAEALFGIVQDMLRAKVGAYSGAKQAELMTQRVRMSRLDYQLRSTILMHEKATEQIWQAVQNGQPISREWRAEIRMVIAQTAANCRAIVDELALAAGSRGNYFKSPVQRIHRDVSALSTHALFEYDHLNNMHGGVILGAGLPEGAML